MKVMILRKKTSKSHYFFQTYLYLLKRGNFGHIMFYECFFFGWELWVVM